MRACARRQLGDVAATSSGPSRRLHACAQRLHGFAPTTSGSRTRTHGYVAREDVDERDDELRECAGLVREGVSPGRAVASPDVDVELGALAVDDDRRGHDTTLPSRYVRRLTAARCGARCKIRLITGGNIA